MTVTNAATATKWQFRSDYSAFSCLADSGGTAVLGTCGTADAEFTLNAPSGGSAGIYYIVKNASGQCMDWAGSDSGVVFTSDCTGYNNQIWIVQDDRLSPTGTDPLYCINYATKGDPVNTPVKVTANCGGASPWWLKAEVSTASSTTSSTPPKATGSSTRSTLSTACIDNEYSTADSGVSLACVKDIQNMLNAMKNSDLYKGAGLTVDGYYGSQTAAQIENFQRYAKISVDGVTGSQTWGSMCSTIHNHHITPGGNAYNAAGC